MPGLHVGLEPEQMVIMAVDTAEERRAQELIGIARDSGAWVVKMGLEAISAFGQKGCSELTAERGLAWVSDSKVKDIPNTVKGAVKVISGLAHPPVGITIHTTSGKKALLAAQSIAGEAGITMLGVTHLTSIDDEETLEYNKVLPRTVVWRESRRAVAGKITGLVSSPQEVGMVKRFKKTKGLFTMIPGTRSEGVDRNDQARVMTPGEAVLAGADLLVIGRQVTDADDPERAYAMVAQEIRSAKRK